jgi:hypothetical protein
MGRVVFPSGTESCCIRSSYVRWWITPTPRGWSLLPLVSGDYKCYNPIVFAFLLVPPAKYQADSRGSEISAVCRPHLSPDWPLWLNVSWRGETLVHELDKYTDRGLTTSLDVRTKGGREQQASRRHCLRWPSRLNELRPALLSRAPFVYPAWYFLRAFPSTLRQRPGYKLESRSTSRTHSHRRRGLN